jgi:hypothetical protein
VKGLIREGNMQRYEIRLSEHIIKIVAALHTVELKNVVCQVRIVCGARDR